MTDGSAGELRRWLRNIPKYAPAPLAQLVERLPYMQDVGGSNPSGCTYGGYSSVGRASVCGSECRGFDPHYSPNKVLYPSGLRGCSAKALVVSSNLTGTSKLPSRLMAGQVVLLSGRLAAGHLPLEEITVVRIHPRQLFFDIILYFYIVRDIYK